MTHDELLKELFAAEFHETYQALCAVAELHKPFEIDREGNYNCQECEWEYPCETIKSIEKELSNG